MSEGKLSDIVTDIVESIKYPKYEENNIYSLSYVSLEENYKQINEH